jgi:hypothetical protein
LRRRFVVNELLAVLYAVLGIFDSITMSDIIVLVVLVIIGIIIIMLIRLFLMLIPAVLLALVVWFFTGSLFWAGIVFLVVAALSLLRKL